MWQALEGFSIIIAVIFVFGLLSLPRRTEKKALFRVGAVPKNAVGQRVLDNSIALEQAAHGKEPRSYSADQKIAPASQQVI
jgi:hypothetical protein